METGKSGESDRMLAYTLSRTTYILPSRYLSSTLHQIWTRRKGVKIMASRKQIEPIKASFERIQPSGYCNLEHSDIDKFPHRSLLMSELYPIRNMTLALNNSKLIVDIYTISFSVLRKEAQVSPGLQQLERSAWDPSRSPFMSHRARL